MQGQRPSIHITSTCLSLVEVGASCGPRVSWRAMPCQLCLISDPQRVRPNSGLPPRAPKPQSQSQAQARAALGAVAGLGEYGLFSVSLFKAQLSGMPMGLFPPLAVASVLQGSWGVASVIVEMLALGA